MRRSLSLTLLLAAAILARSPDAEACVEPSAAGAVPGDGIDDAPAIQTALSFGLSPCVEIRGKYELAKHGTSSIVVPAGKTIRGLGAGSELTMIGDGGNGLWVGIRVVGRGVTIQSLSITVSPLVTGTEEQTHAVEVDAGDVMIDGVRFSNPVRTRIDGSRWPGGDCLRLVGQLGMPIVGITVRGNSFLDCDRSSIAVQRETYQGIIADNRFGHVGDQHIDFELTGSGMSDSWSITGNVFDDGDQGNYSVAVQSVTGVISRVAITGNVFRSRGLMIFNVAKLSVTGNVIDHVATTQEPTVWLSKLCWRCQVSSNTVSRSGVRGPVVGAMDHGTAGTLEAMISGNLLAQDSGGACLKVRGARALDFIGNRCTAYGATTPVVQIERSNNGESELNVNDNTFAGAWTWTGDGENRMAQ